MAHPDWLSGNQIKRAGNLLRQWSNGEEFPETEVYDAVTTLMTYRARFSRWTQPLASVNMSLRSMVRTSTRSPELVEVTQRLKRVDRIIRGCPEPRGISVAVRWLVTVRP